MAKIFHAHLHGDRETKYNRLMRSTISDTTWSELLPQKPFYLLIPQDNQLFSEYDQGWKITEIMPVNSVGIVTARDALTIHWTKEEAWKTVNEFASLQPEQAREKYELGNDARDWKVSMAQSDLKKSGLSKENLTPILYRPFDIRYTYYTGNSRGFHCMPRGEVMQQMLAGENLALITSRLTKGETYRHAQVTQDISEVICMSPKTSNNGFVFPLYLYSKTSVEEEIGVSCRPNFSHLFLNAVTDRLGYTLTPEAIFYYIYAIFHSPTYRSRYAEFLKIDFPRVPLTRDDALFRQLAAYGEQLVALHLMKSPNLDQPITQFVEQGGKAAVEPAHPKYANGKVTINKKGDGFTGVPEEVWNFYVGGYPVCAKWLKDRKGRTLSNEDISHYQRVVVALQETINLMAAIDQTIPGFPIE
jgi:Type ISP C-terminal specificity domain